MWKKRRITSVVLGVSVTITSILPVTPAYGANTESVREMLTAQNSLKKLQRLSTPSDAEPEEDELAPGDELLEDDLGKNTPSNADPDGLLDQDELILATKSNADEARHLAVYPGTVPEVEGVEWEEGVTKEDFEEPYDTVSIHSVDGEEYKVEVVPDDLVYFIDSGAGESSPAYEAVAALTRIFAFMLRTA